MVVERFTVEGFEYSKNEVGVTKSWKKKYQYFCKVDVNGYEPFEVDREEYEEAKNW